MSGVPLLVQTDSSVSGSSGSAPATPQSGPLSLADFFEREGFSPLKNGGNLPVSDVVRRGNLLLQQCCLDMNAIHNDKTQCVKLAFLIARNQDVWLRRHFANDANTATRLVTEVFGDTTRARRLEAYIRKGGDRVIKQIDGYNAAGEDALQLMLKIHPEFVDSDTGPTIFNHPDDFHRVKTMVYWTQECSSRLCWAVCGSLSLLYKQKMENGTTKSDLASAFGCYAINISRYMREMFTDQEVFHNIFLDAGGYPQDMVTRLLEPMNPHQRTITFPVDMFGPDLSPDEVFDTVKRHLRKYGSIMIYDFCVFPTFRDAKTLVFEGEWKAGLPADYKDEKHALLIVGVHRTNDGTRMGGVSFLVQNTWKTKPFVIVGLDLLRSMNLEFGTVIKNGLKFQTFDHGHDPVVPSFVQSGSPCNKVLGEFEVELVELAEEQSSKHADTAGRELENEDHGSGLDPDIWEAIDPNASYSKTTYG